MADKREFLKDLPVQNKDNFRIYHEMNHAVSASKPRAMNIQHKNSIYPTTSDTPLEQRIVNEGKPQVLLKYLSIRGGQYSSQSQGRNPAKRKKTNGVKVQQ